MICSPDVLRLSRPTSRRTRSRHLSIQDVGHLVRDAVGGEPQRLVDMDIALRHGARRAAEQRRDRQFGKAAVASYAREGVAQGVRGDVLESRPCADAIEHAYDPGEMAFTPIGREEEARSGLWLSQQQVDGGAADDPRLRAALRVGKSDRGFLVMEKGTVQSEPLHTAQPRHQKKRGVIQVYPTWEKAMHRQDALLSRLPQGASFSPTRPVFACRAPASHFGAHA